MEKSFINYTDVIKQIEADGFRIIKSTYSKSWNMVSIEVSRASKGDFNAEGLKFCEKYTEYNGHICKIGICRRA